MPTGYTATLMEKGEPFRDFALRCARNFGALVMMRDDPLDAPIPEFEPSDFYAKKLQEAEKELAELKAMDGLARVAYGDKKRAETIEHHEAWLTREYAENERLEEMLAQVKAWEPPTPDHAGLKDFMLQQITVSMNDTKYVADLIAQDAARPAIEYYYEAVRVARNSIASMTEGDRKERERTEERNRWVRALRDSLTNPAAATQV